MIGTRFCLTVIASCVLLLFGTSRAKAIIVFDDGLTHIINTVLSPDDPWDPVYIRNSSGDSPTTLIIVDGGEVTGNIFVEDSSLLQFSGGYVGYVRVSQDAELEVSGGISTNSLNVRENARVTLLDGGNFSGGVEIERGGSPSVVLDGGTVAGNIVVNAGRFEIISGVVGGSIFFNRGELIVAGGLVASEVWVEGDVESTAVTWRGGELLDRIRVRSFAEVTIIGSEFNFPFGSIEAAAGHLTGLLKDGSPIDNIFVRDLTATIELVQVPEPRALLLNLAALCTLALVVRRRAA